MYRSPPNTKVPLNQTTSLPQPRATSLTTTISPALNQTQTVRRSSSGVREGWLIKYNEAKKIVKDSKDLMNTNKNLRIDIKSGITESLTKLLDIVKNCEADYKVTKIQLKDARAGNSSDTINPSVTTSANVPDMEPFKAVIAEHTNKLQNTIKEVALLGDMLKNHQQYMETYKITINEKATTAIGTELLQEVRDLKNTTQELGRRVSENRETAPSYAEILANPKPPANAPKDYAVLITSDEIVSSTDLKEGVKSTLNARKLGLKIERSRIVRGPKILISCARKEDIETVAKHLKVNKKLKVEEAKHRNPLVIIKNLARTCTVQDIKEALTKQNGDLLEGLSAEETAVEERYRRRTRNPEDCHVVLQVVPKLWQRLTSAGRLYVDLQRVRVEDQTPLVQCMKCLGYGHGRKTCITEGDDLCIKCCKPGHTKDQCETTIPHCVNCEKAGMAAGHSVFDPQCLVRQRADKLAREALAYS